jgi:hypothetical protein
LCALTESESTPRADSESSTLPAACDRVGVQRGGRRARAHEARGARQGIERAELVADEHQRDEHRIGAQAALEVLEVEVAARVEARLLDLEALVAQGQGRGAHGGVLRGPEHDVRPAAPPARARSPARRDCWPPCRPR